MGIIYVIIARSTPLGLIRPATGIFWHIFLQCHGSCTCTPGAPLRLGAPSGNSSKPIFGACRLRAYLSLVSILSRPHCSIVSLFLSTIPYYVIDSRMSLPTLGAQAPTTLLPYAVPTCTKIFLANATAIAPSRAVLDCFILSYLFSFKDDVYHFRHSCSYIA